MKKIIVEGYGPSDIIERLRNAAWEPCGMGKNFRGIEFGNRVLAKPSDPYCPLSHQVTVAVIPGGPHFQVQGYSFENLCDGVQNGSLKLILAGCSLVDPPLSEIGDLTPYRVIIELF